MNYQPLKKRFISAILFTMTVIILSSLMARAGAQTVGTINDVDSADNTVAENSPVGTRVGITARADNATNYTLSDSVDGLFAINRQSGVVTVALDLLDHEAFTSHTIAVLAGNNTTSNQTMSFLIQVTDVNEPLSPIIDVDLSPNEIPHGATAGTPVGITVSSVDPEGMQTGYFLFGGDQHLFDVHRDEGVFFLFSDDDYEPDRDYIFTATASTGERGTSVLSKDFTVRLDEPIPIASSPVTSTVREGESQDIIISFAEKELELIAITAGRRHSCGITSENDAVCWGSNTEDSDGTFVGQSIPPADQKFIAISVGTNHSCGITTDNDAVCWGWDSGGRVTPPSGKKFIAISAGYSHNCAITFDNEALCWGNDSQDQATPPSDRKFIAINSGESHTCGITTDNEAVCWGFVGFFDVSKGTAVRDVEDLRLDANGNVIDEEGNPLPITNQLLPPRGRKFTAISAASFHSCGITLDNKAVCWGLSRSGQLRAPSDKRFSAVDGGSQYSCGLTFDNEAVCWGSNSFGRSDPPAGRRFIAIGAGGFHTCGITTDNKVVCWGSNTFGRAIPPQKSPVPASAIAAPITITATVAVESKGQVSVMGNGQIVIPAGETQATLAVAVTDDDAKESTTSHIIRLSAAGPAELNQNRLTITVPVDDQDSVEDIDGETGGAVAENSPVGAAVGITVRIPNATTYTLVDNADGLFSIGREDGIVRVATNGLDHEAFPVHAIIAEAYAATASGTIPLAIRVTDVPEPIRSIADIDFSPNKIYYGYSRGTPVGITARASDPDQGSAVTYRLSKNPDSLFAINSQSGVVTLASDDYDLDQDYLIEVTAESSDNTSSSARFTVRRDEPIRIAPSPAVSTLREGESQAVTFSFAQIGLELIAVSAGQAHSCGITPDNRAICWGNNASGQATPPSGKKFTAISAGDNHTCGITLANDAACWGSDARNQSAPPSGKKFIAVSAGDDHSCGITPGNRAICWGDNVFGQTTPPSGRKFIAISLGATHSCGITVDNAAVCWGSNLSNESASPANRKFIAIGAGRDHTCGITLDNKAVCWGDNTVNRATPPSGRKFVAIDSGFFHTCAITPDNDAVCWGTNNNNRSSPPSGKKFIALSTGANHTCGITIDNEAACWGSGENSLGQLVGQSSPPRISPIAADPVAITAMISEADREQISISDNGQTVIPAGTTQMGLTVAAVDDNLKESKADYTISISISTAGRVELERDKLVVTVLADDRDIIEDVDNADNAVAENSPVGAGVGITVRAATAAYTLSDSVDGLFAVNPQSGVVSVAMNLLDYEALPFHTIIVQVSDSADNLSTVPFFIRVTDAPEPVGHIADIDFNPNEISYGAMRGTPVGVTARAADPDQGSTVTYSLSEDAGGLFAIGRRDGILTLTSDSYDFDQDYLVEVTARSNDNTSSAAQFIIRPDEPIPLAPSPAASIVREGESQAITFSFAEADLEFKDISAGGSHSCGIATDNNAFCWGGNSYRQSSPPESKKFSAISAGQYHSCAIALDNAAVCWGFDGNNQTAPPSFIKFVAIISAGDFHNCGITVSNIAVCWGLDADDRASPPANEKFIAIGAGLRHSCAIAPDNEAVCWGSDGSGQRTPPAGRRFIALSAGQYHNCALTLDNKASCWGSDTNEQGIRVGQSEPPADRKFIAISAGQYHSCGVTIGNDAVCWGDDRSGQGSPPAGRKFIAINAGGKHSCGITTDNNAVCWGAGSDKDRAPPRIIPTAVDSITITATVSDADRGQASISDNGQAVIPVGETQITLRVTVTDDDVKEPESDHTINLSATAHAAFERDEITITVPSDDRDFVEDADDRGNAVAENSPVGAEVGITVRVTTATDYTLTDNAGGLFAINRQSGVVSLAMAGLDHEAFPFYVIVVRFSDAVSGSTIAFNIQITDVPEPISPVIDVDFNPNKIIYGSMPGDAVGITARAVDPDRGSVVSYSLSEDADGLFAIGRRDGVVTLASGNYEPDQDYLIEVTAISSDDPSAPSVAQFTVRRDEPVRIALSPARLIIEEGESQAIALSFIEAELELESISAGYYHSCGVTPGNRAVCWGSDQFSQRAPPSGKRFIAISAGDRFTCAITTDNDAVCWGVDGNGQLTPPAGKKFVAISAGAFHGCAITADSETVCWGGDESRPTVPPSVRLIALSAGNLYNCGITLANEAVCWGINLPAQGPPPSHRKYIAVSAGEYHSCGVTLDNNAVCWGDGIWGRDRPPPGKYIAVSAGEYHSCAITTAREAVCWGRNTALNGEALGQSEPPSDKKFIAVSAGEFHSCGVTADNEAVCWGDNKDDNGILVGQSSPSQAIPAAASSITVAAMVAGVDRKQLSLSGEGRVVIPAGEAQAALTVAVTDDDAKESATIHTIRLSVSGPAELERDEIIITVPADNQDLVEDTDGEAGGMVAENSPVGTRVGITVQSPNANSYTLSDSAEGLFAISSQSGVVSVAMARLDYEAFPFYIIAVEAIASATASETIYPVIRVVDVPEPIKPIVDIDFSPNQIAFGSSRGGTVGITARAVDPDRGSAVTYSLREDSTGLFTIGRRDGVVTLASGDYDPDKDYLIEVAATSSDDPSTSRVSQFTVRRDEPIRIVSSPAVSTLREGESQDIAFSLTETELELIAISVGSDYNCGITPDNGAFCWGSNASGKSAPPSGRKFIAVSAGGNHSCGITADNDAVCWGSNFSGKSAPPSGRKFITVSAGAEHSCGIASDNEAVCWGSNVDIDGVRVGQSEPPSGKRFIAISAGSDHTCGITADNEAACWGGNKDAFSQVAGQSSPPSNIKFVAISAGSHHNCGVTFDNDAVCWGTDFFKQSSPPADKKFIAIGAGADHSCGITFDNDAICWGDNGSGKSSPTSGGKFIAIGAGSFHSCAITTDNEAACWGNNVSIFNNLVGQSSPPQIIPTVAAPITIAAMISGADRGQISYRADGQITIPVGETQATLTVTAGDDDIIEPETDYTIPLIATGHIALEPDRLTITVPADNGDTQMIGDIDKTAGAVAGVVTDGAVAESSPTGTEVGITVFAAGASAYTLVEDATGRFTIDGDSGVVTVADGSLLNFERATSHNIIAQAENTNISTVRLTIQVINVDEATLMDTNDADNIVSDPAAGAAVIGLELKADHPDIDIVGIASWELDEQSGRVFEVTEPQDSSTQTLRIRDGADINSIGLPGIVTVTVRTAHDKAEEGFFIGLEEASIMIRVRVYLEGALE